MSDIELGNGLMGKKEREELISKAASLGWTMTNHSPMTFTKGAVNVWQCREFWQCADLIDGHYRNHRPYPKVTTAFEKE
jgi:hypothetical protein